MDATLDLLRKLESDLLHMQLMITAWTTGGINRTGMKMLVDAIGVRTRDRHALLNRY